MPTQKGTRVLSLISLWDSLMFGRLPKNAAPTNLRSTSWDNAAFLAQTATNTPLPSGDKATEVAPATPVRTLRVFSLPSLALRLCAAAVLGAQHNNEL